MSHLIDRLSLLVVFALVAPLCHAEGLERIPYNNPGLTVDLGVGLWALPLPMDFDGDGAMDLVVNCPDKPHNGVWFFKNTSGKGVKMPVFAAGKRISKGMSNVCVSYVNGKPIVMRPGTVFDDFLTNGLENGRKLEVPAKIHPNKIRADQWKLVDFDGDGKHDLVVGVEDWTDYGWDDAYDANGRWMNGKLRGFIYWLKNTGTNEMPVYEKPKRIEAAGHPIDTYGMPSPNFSDFDGDGDLDLICGEFMDGFTHFENTGTSIQPKYATGKRLKHEGKYLQMNLEMIVPVGVDWDGDGDVDLIVGDEDGRVAFIENTGKLVGGMPDFLPPVYFQQQADTVKFGALASPVGFDWDGDGDEDIVSGNTAGNIAFIENLSGKGEEHPKWAAPSLLEADGKAIRIMAGPNGSIQGPCEAKWGYTTLSVADWDGDSLPDLIVNSIWGKIVWYKNLGTRHAPKLAAAQMVEVEWPAAPPKPSWVWWQPQPKEFVTQWRTTPMVVDWNKDGLMDIVMLDHEGYLAFYERTQDKKLLPGKRVMMNEKGEALRLNAGNAGKSGRRKLCVVDWDGDGRLDFLINSANANFFRQVDARDGQWFFKDMGPLEKQNIEGHDVSPTVVDWNGDGIPDFLGGAEDGNFYYLRNRRTK